MKNKSDGLENIGCVIHGLAFILVVCVLGCTQNQKAKEFGGTAELTLPANEKLINVTWKDTDLWYLTRPMKSTDSAETYTFKEQSAFGVWSGTYIIHETK